MWKLDGTRGSLDVPELSVSLDLTRPDQGLRVTAVRPAEQQTLPSEHQILQVHFSELPRAADVQDSWIRGTDLVVTYAQGKARQVTAEIYWRLVRSCANAIGTEMILSVQTDLLDATPTTRAASRVSSSEVLWIANPAKPESAQLLQPGHSSFTIDRTAGQGLFAFRQANSRYTYVEMVHPTDFSSASVSCEGRTAIVHWQLFLESLEKGVIRRARLRGLFVDRQDDLQLAAQCFQEFTTSPLPLTT